MPTTTLSRTVRFMVLLLIAFFALTASTVAQPTTPEPDSGLLSLPDAPDASPKSPNFNANLQALRAAAANSGIVRVIVGFNADTSGARFEQVSEAQQIQTIAAAQQSILSRLTGMNVSETQLFTYIPFLALTVNSAALDALANDPTVTHLQFDGLNVGALYDSAKIIGVRGAGGTLARGYTGQEQVIAILDTGVDKNHTFLRDRVIPEAEACYGSSLEVKLGRIVTSKYLNPITNKIEEISAGFEFFYKNTPYCMYNSSAAIGSNTGLNCPDAGCDHGTAIAGTIVGRGTNISIPPDYSVFRTMTGVAPNAKLVVVKVASKLEGYVKFLIPVSLPILGNEVVISVCNLYRPINQVCAVFFDSDILAGMERVYALRNNYNIVAVNVSSSSSLSLSELDPGNLLTNIIELTQAADDLEDILNNLFSFLIRAYKPGADCDGQNPAYVAMVKKLTMAGIAVIAPTGHSNLDGRSAVPSCITGVISVGASEGSPKTEREQVWNYTNTIPNMDLLAPGVNIATSWPKNAYGRETGTSIASAHVAGAWAVLKEAHPPLTLYDVNRLLNITGVDVPDHGGSKLTFKRIDLKNAIAYLDRPLQPPNLLAPINGAEVTPGWVQFRWIPTIKARRYRLVLMDDANNVILQRNFKHKRCTEICLLQLDSASPLPHNVRYTWFIEAFDEATKVGSQVGHFVIFSPRPVPELDENTLRGSGNGGTP